MANIEQFIKSSLDAAQEELAQAEAINRAEDAERPSYPGPVIAAQSSMGQYRAGQNAASVRNGPSQEELDDESDVGSDDESNETFWKRQEERDARDTRITELKAQVQLLAQIKDMMSTQHAETTAILEKQQTETKSHFIAIKKRDDQSTRFSVWLTIGSSAASLVAGWLLSLASSPSSVFHAFGR